MTKEDIDTIIKVICPNDDDFEKPCISPAYLKKELEALSLEQEPCENVMSREEVRKQVIKYAFHAPNMMIAELIEDIRDKEYKNIDTKSESEEMNMRKEELNQILENHKHWLNKDVEHWEEMKADLHDTDLSGADLHDADLRFTNLSRANLHGANLHDADLSYADLGYANLSNTELWGVNLHGANLFGDLTEYRRGKIVTEDILGYKKCIDDIMVTLRIPRGAIIFSINGNQCRTNKVKVIDIEGADRAYSKYNRASYYVGDEITVYNFNCEYNSVCVEGIHFFLTKEEAEKY